MKDPLDQLWNAAEEALCSAERHLITLDKLRRQIVRMQERPPFPTEWGEPIAKYWEVPGANGERFASPIMPTTGPHLTVFRFDGFEATATFDRIRIGMHINGVEVLQSAAPPPAIEWEYFGDAKPFSSIWRRTLTKGGGHE
jgi:hypothetical protein